MAEVGRSHKVVSGDCAWNVAKQNLKVNNQKVTNAAIMAEMKRLAALNNCESVQDFNSKFFSTTGKELILEVSTEGNAPSAKPKTPQTLENRGGETASGSKIKQDTIAHVKDDTVSHAKPRIPSALPDSVKVSEKHIEEADSTRVVKNDVISDTTTTRKILTPAQEEAIYIRNINNMSSDTSRIIEYNKKNYNGQYYGIVDKKTCKLTIYDKQGKAVKSFTVGVGKSKGDGIGSYYLEHAERTKDAWKAESNRFTTAGEFTLDEIPNYYPDAYTVDGQLKMMQLKGDNKGIRSGQIAIHMLYKPQYAKREAAIKSAGLEDNRMSYGCVNLTIEDYNVMHTFLGEGNKIYILPEEQGNKLQLKQQKDGTYKFEQIYHQNDIRGKTKEQASVVKYDVHPERAPRKKTSQVALAQNAQPSKKKQASGQPTKPAFAWYKPSTWFS